MPQPSDGVVKGFGNSDGEEIGGMVISVFYGFRGYGVVKDNFNYY